MELIEIIGVVSRELTSLTEKEIPTLIKNLNFKPVFLFRKSSQSQEIDLANCHFYQSARCIDEKDFSNLQDIKYFIPRYEEDVNIVDKISNFFNRRGNPMRLSNCRRDKYDMICIIKECGIRSILSQRCMNLDDLNEFTEDHKLNKYVLKPVNSASLDGFNVCNGIEELQKCFSSLIGKTNVVGLINDSLIIQEFIEGDEYVVNCVCRDGIIKVTSVWKYERYPNQLYKSDMLIAPEEIPKGLLEYNFQVMKALEINNGASHAEIKIDEKGPVLIEIGARHGGGENSNPILKKFVGYSQIEAMLYALTDEKHFNSLPDLYKIESGYHAKIFELTSYYEGIKWRSSFIENLIKKLKCCIGHRCFLDDEEEIVRTVDCETTIGRVFLISQNENEIIEDEQTIQDWEKNLFN